MAAQKGTKIGALGTYHMVQNNAYEPQRTNNFEIQIVGLPSITNRVSVKGDVFGTEDGYKINTGATKDSSSIVTLSVASFSAPNISVSTITVPFGNNEVKYAGKPSFGDTSVKINDYIGLDVENILSAWQKEVYNYENQKIGLASKYKKQAYIIEFAPDGSCVRQWQLNGCWPSSLNFGDFSYDSNNIRQLDMTITFDWAKPVQ